MVSTGIKSSELSIKHLAKFKIFSLKQTLKIVNFADFVKRTSLWLST
jgi:hypothetical protein